MRGAVRSGHLAKIPTRTLPTHTLEDEDDDEYENDVPHEWRPTGVFLRLGVLEQATTRASPFGRHFQGVISIRVTQG
jgi:hypothetical protein